MANIKIEGLDNLIKEIDDMSNLKNIPMSCPKCGKEICISLGENKCPHCGQIISVQK